MKLIICFLSIFTLAFSYTLDEDITELRDAALIYQNLDNFVYLNDYLSNYYEQNYSSELIKRANEEDTTLGIYLLGNGNLEEGKKLLFIEAEALNVKSSIYLDIAYRYGAKNKFERFDSDILDFVKLMSDYKVPRFIYLLAEYYAYGLGVEEDRELAKELLRECIVLSNLSDAYSTLAELYYSEGNKNKAIDNWKLAADQSNIKAMYNLAVTYKEDKNYKEALKLLHRVIDNDDEEIGALMNLGQMYIEGWGTEKKEEKGLSYYRKASACGEKQADIVIANCYIYGIGVEQDPVRGVEMLYEMAEAGYEPAMVRINQIRKETGLE